MTGWKDDGEYWTRKGTIHHKGGGKYIESVRKDTNYVNLSQSRHHAKRNNTGGS